MNKGDKLHGFTVKRVRELAEIDAVLVEMEHDGTGAELAFLDRADTNKTFGISFKTLPEDDTGVFHIMEHSVLCGSEKFPLKEPFVDLLKSSLKTFLNAMTFNDKTVYPVASRNDKDFYNLVDVYMDAVLHPLALVDERVFRQEGWHYELSESGELSYNGVVYNEMKGAYSSPDGVAEEQIMQLLFPNSPYAKDSGGNPSHIPELTFEGFRAAHEKFYNPSNAQIFLDGEVKLDEILPLLDSYLAGYERRPVRYDVTLPDYERGARRELAYEISPSEDEEGKCRIFLAGRTARYDDIERTLALSTLTSALAGSNEAPLKRALLDSGLCEDVSLCVNDGILCGFYELEIRNVRRENIDTVIELTKETLTKVYKNGLDRARLSALFNSAEFRHREKDFGSMPRGLIFGLSMLDTWLWGGDPAATLTVGDTFARLREKIVTGYFEDLLRETFIDEAPVTVVLTPSRTLGAEREAESRRLLSEIKATMSDAELSEIAENTRALKKWQAREDSPEAIATLPSLSVSDIDPDAERVPLEKCEVKGSSVYSVTLPTSGITYLDLYFNASDLTEREILLLPTLASLYKNVRTARYTTSELRNRLLSVLGNLSFNPVSLPDADGTPGVYMTVSISALDEHRSDMTELAEEILYTSELGDKKELRSAISQGRLGAEEALVAAGHAQALTRAAAYVTAQAVADEYLTGYAQYAFLAAADKSFDESADRMIAELTTLADKIFRRERLSVVCTAQSHDGSFADSLVSAIRDGGSKAAAPTLAPLGKRNEGIAIPSQVSYAITASDVFSNPHGSHLVTRSIISYSHLWNSVRVLGGAYGAGLVARRTGVLAFYSYRDPSPRRSIDCYAESGKFLREFVKSGESLEKFIIGAFGDYDTLATPRVAGSKAGANALRGWTDEMENTFRREIIGTTGEDLLSVADLLDKASEQRAICVIGPESALDSCSDVLAGRLTL